MKLNTRIFAIALASASVVAANAQYSFYLGYGNAAFAALNGAAVGDALKPGVNLIPQIGGSFTVSLFAKNNGAAFNAQGGAIFVGFDSASTNGTANYATTAAAGTAAVSKKLFADSISNLGTGYNGLIGSANDPGTVDFQLQQAARYAGNFGSGTSLRSLGLWAPVQFGTANKLVFSNGQTVRVADYNLSNIGLANGDIFGDASNENGLSVNHVTNATSRATFLDPRASNPSSSVKYQVQAVPEPGTMIAVAAGLAAFARRRRSK